MDGEGEKHPCVVTSCAVPAGDLTHNPGMCPRMGIKLATLWFAGWHSIHWATPARATLIILKFSILGIMYLHWKNIRNIQIITILKFPKHHIKYRLPIYITDYCVSNWELYVKMWFCEFSLYSALSYLLGGRKTSQMTMLCVT